MIKEYKEQAWTLPRLAKKYNMSSVSITYQLKKAKVYRPKVAIPTHLPDDKDLAPKKRTKLNKKKKTECPFDVKQKKNYLAIRVRKQMDEKGWTAEELAFASGVSHQTIFNVCDEKGVMLNNGNTLMGIAIALGVQLDWLLHHLPQGHRMEIMKKATTLRKKK